MLTPRTAPLLLLFISHLHLSAGTSTGTNLGKWSPVIKLPIIPVAVFTVPEYPDSSRLLMFSSNANMTYAGDFTGQTQFTDFNYKTGQATHRTVVDTHHDMFCPGMSTMAEGKVMITGGATGNATTIYDPSTNEFTAAAPMTMRRGYQAQTTLSDGRIFLIGASWGNPTREPNTPIIGADFIGGKDGEVYDPATREWTFLPGADSAAILTQEDEYGADNHAWLFAWKHASIFHAGPSRAMHWFSAEGEGSYTDAGVRGEQDAMCGMHAMYDAVAGRIFAAGGSPMYDNFTALSSAVEITIGEVGEAAVVERVPDMHFQRQFANVAVLPDGMLFVTGGQTFGAGFTDLHAVLTPELYDPVAKKFTLMAPHAVPRNYHSVSVLLSDARVLIGGGGLCALQQVESGDCDQSNDHPDAEIFSPPYLFDENGNEAERPVIEFIGETHVYPGDELSFTVGGVKSTEGMSFALVRVGSATHSVNSDQRRIPLTPDENYGYGLEVTFTLPEDAGILNPGPYFLFAMSKEGVPSVAKTLLVQI